MLLTPRAALCASVLIEKLEVELLAWHVYVLQMQHENTAALLLLCKRGRFVLTSCLFLCVLLSTHESTKKKKKRKASLHRSAVLLLLSALLSHPRRTEGAIEKQAALPPLSKYTLRRRSLWKNPSTTHVFLILASSHCGSLYITKGKYSSS